MSNNNNGPAATTLSSLALMMAQQQIGQQELPLGSNSGPMVDKYLLSVGLNPGYAWCQAFVYWCFANAAARLNYRCPVIRTAGVLDCWNKTSTSQKITKAAVLKDPSLVLPGYQFILLYGGGKGHTGIVEKAEGQVIYTIEGNSNDTGGREGYEVVRHKRLITDKALCGFIKYN